MWEMGNEDPTVVEVGEGVVELLAGEVWIKDHAEALADPVTAC